MHCDPRLLRQKCPKSQIVRVIVELQRTGSSSVSASERMEDVSLDETVSETFSQNHSPKVSTNGTFEDSFHKRDAFQSVEAGPGLQGHSLHDHHHWDMPRFGGAKSVTSSVGVERDESVADEQTVEVGEGLPTNEMLAVALPSFAGGRG